MEGRPFAPWEDLQLNGLGVYRAPGGFNYGHDAVALSDFVRAKPGWRMLDLGTGTGILPLLIHAKTGAAFTGVEIDGACCALARQSVERNGLTDKITVAQGDIRTLTQKEMGLFDGVVCNPPYYPKNSGQSPEEARARSAFETACTLEDAIACAGRLLKNGGLFFVCYPAERIASLCAALCGHGLEPKRLRFVRAKKEKAPYLILAEAKKGGRPGVILEEITLE